ncbi:MAG TPA: 2-C-methyl-D-erythritol 2,4-cyclodiphosphate synthase [Candidatus Hydrogenedentes bacterium]|nr:2-C-methyl-D-erythritol 2,4-cyclodiphosphate synthase [Candidatus Hydrogenedentota bacterium]HOS03152.1 2-C-methyl-D-erythritol 2,4-cyclodiphosphate synthase [Candidatus Hydrogenedentota bacterium]
MMRVGLGYDLHRLVEGRPLILGGVMVPWEKGLFGHSDADVLAHAITDALLGAAALGNIGQHFPDTDPAYKDADSLRLLAEAAAMLRGSGYAIVNVDANIVAQRPKLNPHIDSMRQNIAACLGLPVDRVSVKAKTNEEVGPEGRGEAISAQAVALVSKG